MTKLYLIKDLPKKAHRYHDIAIEFIASNLALFDDLDEYIPDNYHYKEHYYDVYFIVKAYFANSEIKVNDLFYSIDFISLKHLITWALFVYRKKYCSHGRYRDLVHSHSYLFDVSHIVPSYLLEN